MNSDPTLTRAAVGGLLATVAALGMLLRGPHPYGAEPVPEVVLQGKSRPEGCLACHPGVQGLGSAHDPASIGCSPCHLGDPLALSEHAAHKGMSVLAGDLRIVDKTCGLSDCHPSETTRVDAAVMAGAPGLLAVDRFAFGERATPSGTPQDDLRSLDGSAPPRTPAESHVRKLCASCHLGAAKEKQGDLGFDSRGGGCTACHLAPPASTSTSTSPIHPDVSAAVSESRCEGCHSRSGRISLSFHGKVEREENSPMATEQLPDGRPISRTSPDVHAAGGMTCIDCHVERELMGDGERHLHGDEALEVKCQDCHGPFRETTVSPDTDQQRVASVLRASWEKRGIPKLTGRPWVTAQGTPLWRTDGDTGAIWLSKTGMRRDIPAASPAPYHLMRGHERLSCQACHTALAPRCPTCHTHLDSSALQFDHVTGKETPGMWVEAPARFGFDAPFLAVRGDGTIGPFVEGMHLTIAIGANRSLERRLWAPLDAHTTGGARGCASCHGPLWEETYPDEGETTRTEATLLDAAARDRVGGVGECLLCHDRYEDPVWLDFGASKRQLELFRDGTGPGSPELSRCKAP